MKNRWNSAIFKKRKNKQQLLQLHTRTRHTADNATNSTNQWSAQTLQESSLVAGAQGSAQMSLALCLLELDLAEHLRAANTYLDGEHASRPPTPQSPAAAEAYWRCEKVRALCRQLDGLLCNIC